MAFAATELARLAGCLDRLRPHLDGDEVALTGGVAIELCLAVAGRQGRRTTVADLDLVARRPGSVRASLADEFPIVHYHVPAPGQPKFMVMVVDRIARLRVDIFPDLAGALARARRLPVAGAPLLVLDAESILEHKLLTLARATADRPVDIKHQLDALALAELCGRSLPPVPAAHLGRDLYSTDLEARCARCESSRDPAFPLAPRAEIFALLGYV